MSKKNCAGQKPTDESTATTIACIDEDCDSHDVQPRASDGPDWLCRGCGKEFDEPRRREPKVETAFPDDSLTHQLDELDADAIGGGE